MKVALYTRISTTSDRQNIDTQTHALKQYCERREWEIVAEYSDEGSGRKTTRKQFQQLKKDTFKRKFDIVLVFRFDRFARSTKELLESLETFQSLGIEFVSYTEQVDTTTPAGKALFSIAGIFAEFESNIASERIKAGIDHARSKGKKIGRPKALVMKKEEEIVSKLQDGFSNRKTAKLLNVSVAHVQKVRAKREKDLLLEFFSFICDLTNDFIFHIHFLGKRI